MRKASLQLSGMKAGSYARVIVLGCSGSGKSTLAAKLAAQLAIPFIATDAVYWRQNWIAASSAEVGAWLEMAIAQPRWVLDGNFDAQRDMLWRRAELAVWLDLPWTLTVWQVLRRNLIWWAQRKPVWCGSRITLKHAIGGVLHAARSHAQKRRDYPRLLRDFPNLTVLHIQG